VASVSAVLNRLAVDESFAKGLSAALSSGDATEALNLLAGAGVKDMTVNLSGERAGAAALHMALGWSICVTVTICYP
jgi:hypothetical protein